VQRELSKFGASFIVVDDELLMQKIEIKNQYYHLKNGAHLKYLKSPTQGLFE
jgi:hypothetical protein